MDEKKPIKNNLLEHAFKLVLENLSQFEKFELEQLAFAVDVDLRERRFREASLNFTYVPDPNVDITFSWDIDTDEDK